MDVIFIAAAAVSAAAVVLSIVVLVRDVPGSHRVARHYQELREANLEFERVLDDLEDALARPGDSTDTIVPISAEISRRPQHEELRAFLEGPYREWLLETHVWDSAQAARLIYHARLSGALNEHEARYLYRIADFDGPDSIVMPEPVDVLRSNEELLRPESPRPRSSRRPRSTTYSGSAVYGDPRIFAH
jgi:hypothetical protein